MEARPDPQECPPLDVVYTLAGPNMTESMDHEVDTTHSTVSCPPPCRPHSYIPRGIPDSHQRFRRSAFCETDETLATRIREPETQPISKEQLIAEVKGIYAGLVMVESKCIEVDNAQNAQRDSPYKLNNEQWQALIALFRTLLHEYHDFFLASQLPSFSLNLQRLASKYSMPARMWRHGIHSFLELLRHRLPTSLEQRLTFIYLAYPMMALLYETVPAFEDTWIESLGDLGRYRMAIEDDNLHDREVWTGVCRHWYAKASDKAPTTRRLCHPLAILTRPNAIQQLHYYVKSLCVPIPFYSAQDSIMTLFDPILGDITKQPQPAGSGLIRNPAFFFSSRGPTRLLASMKTLLGYLDRQISRITRLWLLTMKDLKNDTEEQPVETAYLLDKFSKPIASRFRSVRYISPIRHALLIKVIVTVAHFPKVSRAAVLEKGDSLPDKDESTTSTEFFSWIFPAVPVIFAASFVVWDWIKTSDPCISRLIASMLFTAMFCCTHFDGQWPATAFVYVDIPFSCPSMKLCHHPAQTNSS